MSENIKTDNSNAETASNSAIPPIPQSENDISLKYILEQIEKIQASSDYISWAIDSINAESDGGVGMGIGNIVEEREKTNRQLISFYEKMYDDLRKDRILEQKEIILSTAIQSLAEGITPLESGATLHDIVELALKDLNENK